MYQDDRPVTDSIVIYRQRRHEEPVKPSEIISRRAIERYWEYYIRGAHIMSKHNLTLPEALGLARQLADGEFISVNQND